MKRTSKGVELSVVVDKHGEIRADPLPKAVLAVVNPSASGKYWPSPEAEALAKVLIAQIPEHRHLAESRLLFLFRAGKWASKGKPVFAKAEVLPDKYRTLLGADALIIVNADAWKGLDEDQRQALIDHELCHLTRDDEGNLKLASHDVEEFAAVIRRHGLWHPDLQVAATAFAQLSLPMEVGG